MTIVHASAREANDGVQTLNPLEIPSWDAQVGQLPGATFFHSAAWARVLNVTYGYTPKYLGVYQAGRLGSLLPLMEVDSWLTGRRGVSLPFTDAVPPLCSDASAFNDLLLAAKSEATARQWKYLEIRGGKEWLPQAPSSTTFYNHSLALQADEKAVFSGFDDAVRRAIRKSERSGLTLEFSQSPEGMQTFYQLLCQTRQRHGVPPQPYRFFAAIQEHVLAPNHGWLVIARQGKTPVASGVFFHFGRHAIYKFGASDEKLQQLRANNLVMWNAIQHYAREGFETFDFGRTSLDNEGLRRFKTSWGTEEIRMEYTRYDLRSSTYVAAKDESAGWHTRVFNRLPIFLARPIGALLYPHMG